MTVHVLRATPRLEHARDPDGSPQRRCARCHGPWAARAGYNDFQALPHAPGCAAAHVRCARCGDTGWVDTWPVRTFAPVRCRCPAGAAR